MEVSWYRGPGDANPYELLSDHKAIRQYWRHVANIELSVERPLVYMGRHNVVIICVDVCIKCVLDGFNQIVVVDDYRWSVVKIPDC